MRRPQLKKNQTALVPGIIQLKIILRWKTDGFRAALPRKARSSAEDLFSAAGLPLRASVGFLVYPALQEKRNVQLILLLFLPILRFLKLLRYFETFRLLIHAARNAMAALPVLFYIMVVITLVAATAIYLVESRTNIPTMHHSLWLAIVTMTTVGYGDYYPKSLLGYIVASILTFVSVLFLALPVGIIGNEFTACWQSRHQVLLKTRVRKCLLKWGYTAKDLQLLIQYVDVDEDGFLTLSEFLELIQQRWISLFSLTLIRMVRSITVNSCVKSFQKNMCRKRAA
ncbi:unnamed protein product [Cladocopium goreaui]|uniref:Potassium voltage-gated channel subfamily A member 6 n=1 Tax=Cladocopium goreaui TaxID=2562237 RepID=A0A9P1BKC9_9DINO|nr:unnamed protein product [Cladocopium goreaui]